MSSYRQAKFVVNLQKLKRNYGQLKSIAKSSVFCAVVKADAYGHGAIQISKALAGLGLGYFAVALVEEGINLRESGIKGRIMLLCEPPKDSIKDALYYGLEPTVYSFRSIEEIVNNAGHFNKFLNVRTSRTTRVPLHLKVNTGMNRLGCSPREVVGLSEAILGDRRLKFASLWTHFARADEIDSDLTERQFKVFKAVKLSLRKHDLTPEMFHVSNSAAIMRNAKYHLDMVRGGISLYGYYPSAEFKDLYQKQYSLEPVASLVSQICHIQRVNKNEGVSYGHRFVASEPTHVGIVPLGYADGIPRNLGFKEGKVLISGKFYPIVGTVTMDYFMVDLGYSHDVKNGDEVVVIGCQNNKKITFDDWAKKLNSISYEMLLRISSRVPKIYI